MTDSTHHTSIEPVVDTWNIIEQTLREVGMTGPALGGLFDSRAEEVAKAIVARLAANDPPILLYYYGEAER